MESTLSHLRTLFAMFNLEFPNTKLITMLTKQVKQIKGGEPDRGALCPHDWLPICLMMSAARTLPVEI
jgi:replicative DNA helicase